MWERPPRGFREGLPRGAATAAAGGAGCAVLSVVMLAALDGVQADEYALSNRASFGFLLAILLVVLPFASFAVFVVATDLVRGRCWPGRYRSFLA